LIAGKGKNWWLVWGYIFSVIWPIGGVLIGAYYLLATKKRAHGAAMIFLSFLVMAVILLGLTINRMEKGQ